MSSNFSCPECGELHDIGRLEMWELYEEDGKETEFDCPDCGAEIIITSVVHEWTFETEIRE